MKDKLFRFLTIMALMFAISFTAPTPASAQCPMCRMSAESNLKNGGTQGSGLNAGILYMLSLPYILVGGIAFVWYRNRRKAGDAEENQYVD